ncbi:MAG: ketoacyl-ACP synthase III [Candidatus Marinimicrobia bacterium]|jgi:3-oxoacyl-[acyl-carrier-protein] synthase-3|nr:ketoacyl-ACP synthase III [Candidatus Neomarinimicrobiota bacterium]|tara:strand:- start:1576 stop:2583 length:1008 start_codon:yes stop_codon:yes gene_type:complete
MKQTQLKANITATGKYLPKEVLTNHDMAKLVETSDEWIQTRTGIRERRKVQKGEATVDMSTNAVRDLMERYDLDAKEIDAIIVATVTPDMILPCSAALVQKNINAVNAWGYDLSAACSGFLFGLESGAALIVSGRCEKVIVIGADTMSSILNYEDRNTCILFGDGAGAVLLEPSEEFGIIDSELRIDGTGGEFLRVDGGGSLHPASHETVSNKLHYVRQDGKTVYKFAVRGMADISYEVAERNNLKGDDISLFIPHQANKRIIDAAAKRLGLKESQVMINIDTYANTTSATIPICIAEVSEKNMLNFGDNVIISTFGAGFSWGAMYLKWGMQANA